MKDFWQGILALLAIVVTVTTVGATKTVHAAEVVALNEEVQCARAFDPDHSFPDSCIPDKCRRRIVDGVFTEEDITVLRAIAEKGMATRPNIGGPTILDINTGYIRDSAGLENLFMKSQTVFNSDDFSHYGRIIRRLREEIMETFSLSNVYFTAPTFITRIDSTKNWSPKEIHDEYWHPHVDRNNTPHYQYSGLLYLSTYAEDFQGGRFVFLNSHDYEFYDSGRPLASEQIANDANVELVVEPRAGRVAIFSSDMENTHQVEQVTGGQRFVLSFWFTCDPRREFEIFLDGNAHIQFGQRLKDNMIRRAQQQSQKRQQASGSPKQPRTTSDL